MQKFKQQHHAPAGSASSYVSSSEGGLCVDDRRMAQRYSVRNAAISMKWYREFVLEECQGVLCDLSVGGALLICESLPPAGAPIWIRLEAEAESDWVEVMGLEARNDGGGLFRVRVAFATCCPFVVFRTAVWGRLASDLNESRPPAPAAVVTPPDVDTPSADAPIVALTESAPIVTRSAFANAAARRWLRSARGSQD